MRSPPAVRRPLALTLAPWALALCAITTEAHAQPGRPRPTEARDAGAEPEEPPDPGSPRASMTRFVALAREGRWSDAARYLDVPRSREAEAPLLATHLKEVLDRNFWLDPAALSVEPLGDPTDGLPPRTDEVGRVRGPSGALEPVRVARHDYPDGPRWVFTRYTVSRVDVWYAQLDGRWAREHLPGWLRASGPRELLLWQWAALPLIALVALALGRLVIAVALNLVTRALRRRQPDFDVALTRGPAGPLSALVAVPLCHAAVAELGLYPPAQSFVTGLLRAGLFVALFWGLWRSVALLSQAVLDSPWGRSRPGSVTLVPMGARVLRILIFALSVTAVLSALGYPVASLLAGLGIGGLALALAAQKTGEHLFGSVAIGLDQPFRVGDFIKVEDHMGTIESVGLRSTRMRTLDRTVVTIPNGKLADLRVENYSARDRFHLHCILGLARSTTAERARAVIQSLRDTLLAHPLIWEDDLWVAVKEISSDAVVVELRAWFKVTAFDDFHPIRTELLLRFLEVVEAAGAELAYPTRTVQLVGSPAPSTVTPPGHNPPEPSRLGH